MRLNHAILDADSRHRKTAKIARILERRKNLFGAKILEVGTGSGIIAASLVGIVGGDGSVYATDVKDQRITAEGYEFREVSGTGLPFQNDQFDIVISNHVIEHVGGETDQLHHLAEIRRVMKSNALLYLAVPNKWRLIEPHYRVPFLSWLPQSVANFVVRLTRKNTQFDCRLLSRRELRELFRKAGFEHVELDREAMEVVGEIEGSRVATLLSRLPSGVLALLLLIVPTLVVVAKKSRT